MRTLKLLLALIASFVCFAGQAQMLWRVELPGAKSPSYLFGTMHFAPGSFADSTAGFADALNAVDELYVEVSTDDLLSSATQKMFIGLPAMMPAGQTFATMLTEQQYAKLDSITTATLGVGAEMLVRFKPIILTVMLEALKATEASLPNLAVGDVLDLGVMSRAEKAAKPIRALETAQGQMNILLDISLEAQRDVLVSTLENWDEDTTGRMVKAYFARDLDALERLVYAYGEDSEFTKAFIDDRNRRWLETLLPVMRQRGVMVAVGAGHLVGPAGLIESLRRAGATVIPVDKKEN